MSALHPYFQKSGFRPLLHEEPDARLGICVVMPSYNEPELEHSLRSLARCQQPACAVEVMVVINYPENALPRIIDNAHQCLNLVTSMENKPLLQFHPIFAGNLPRKQAGVGLARKIGMDEAAFRFAKLNRYRGIIACFDADSTCSSNYLLELEKLWNEFSNTAGCSIHFEHPLSGIDFSPSIYEGIAQYELHLRYYIEGARYINHPHSFHTIGSSMACSANAYLQHGGMNKRKAGEDFYFLQKIIPHGEHRELNSACIYPSPRPSDRVPFGTGNAIGKMIDQNFAPFLSYNMEAWEGLKHFFELSDNLYQERPNLSRFLSQLEPSLAQFLIDNKFNSGIEEVRANTSSAGSFRKRFYLWFDAFKLLKYMNYAHHGHFKRKPVAVEALKMAQKRGIIVPEETNCFGLLASYRKHQASSAWQP